MLRAYPEPLDFLIAGQCYPKSYKLIQAGCIAVIRSRSIFSLPDKFYPFWKFLAITVECEFSDSFHSTNIICDPDEFAI